MWEYNNAINFFLKLMDRTLIILTVLSLMLYCAFSCSGTAGTVQVLITNFSVSLHCFFAILSALLSSLFLNQFSALLSYLFLTLTTLCPKPTFSTVLILLI